MKTSILCGTLIAAAGAAQAGTVSSFTETFESGAAGWIDGSFGTLTEVGSGALDGSAYVSYQADLNSAGPFGLTLFRGQDAFDASGDAFVGDYAAGGITTISFDIRHNAGQDLGIALRVATSMNFPAFAVELAGPISSDSWTTVSFDLSFGNPLLTLEGAPTPALYNSIITSVGNIQVSADRPDGLDSELLVDFDIDNVSIVPAPSGVAMLALGGLVGVRRRR